MTTQMNLGANADVFAFLKAQHRQIEKLFGEVLNAKGAEKESAFAKLKALMTAHEKGEESIVHPVAATKILRGDVLVSNLLHEESMAKRAVSVIEHIDIHTVEFDDKLRAIQTDVVRHAESEEHEEFDKLALVLDKTRPEQMLKALQAVEVEAIGNN